jgi:hypothetical protein
MSTLTTRADSFASAPTVTTAANVATPSAGSAKHGLASTTEIPSPTGATKQEKTFVALATLPFFT